MAETTDTHHDATDLNELLLAEESQGTVRRGLLAVHRKKILIGLVVVVAAAAIAGIVAGTLHARNSSSNNNNTPQNSANGDSYQIQSDPEASADSKLEIRPMFSKPIGALDNAPPPVVYQRTEFTESSNYSFSHTFLTNTGCVSHTRLEFNVVKRTNAYCPSTYNSVLAITCQPSQLRFAFVNASEAFRFTSLWGNGTILFMRAEWGCDEHVRQFTAPPVWNAGRYFEVLTINVSISAAFESANISFFTNHTEPTGPVILQPPLATQSPLTSGRRRSLWSSLLNMFGGASNTVEDLTQLAVTGELDSSSQPFTASYALPPYTLNTQDQYGSASASFAGTITLQTQVSLVVQDYTINDFYASVTGDLSTTLSANVNAQYSYSSSASQPLVNQVTVACGVVPVLDIPIPVKLLFTVQGGYSFSAAASGSLTATANPQGTAYVGMSYAANEGMSPYASAGFSVPSFTANGQAQVQASAQVFLAPQLYLQIAYIGGPRANFIASASASLPDNSCTVSGNAQIEIDGAADASIPQWISKAFLQSGQGSSGSVGTPVVPLYGPVTVWSGTQELC